MQNQSHIVNLETAEHLPYARHLQSFSDVTLFKLDHTITLKGYVIVAIICINKLSFNDLSDVI